MTGEQERQKALTMDENAGRDRPGTVPSFKANGDGGTKGRGKEGQSGKIPSPGVN